MTWRPSLIVYALALLGLSAPSVRAQSPPMAFERLSLEHGLSQTTVLCIFQDSRGFMWFGTEDGLNRYDGVSFKTYKYDPADHTSLPNSMVWAIVEDSRGDLWVGTEGGGIARWDHRLDRFVRVPASPGQPSPLSTRVRTLHLAEGGTLWIGTKDAGLARYEPARGEFTFYRHDAGDPKSLSHNGVFAIVDAGGGQLWVGTDGGLNRFDPATGKSLRYLFDPADAQSLGNNQVRSLRVDREGRLWVGTYGGLSRLEPGQGRFRRYRHEASAASLSHDRVRTILEDASGRLWIGTDGGLDLMDRQRTVFRHYRHDPTDPSSLGDDNVMSLHQDGGGVLWVGTRNAGVHKWYPGTWSFGHRTRLASEPDGLSDKIVTSFAEDATGRIWIGTFGGLHTMDRLTGQIRRFAATKAGLSDRVMALVSDAEGMLWIGTMDAGLVRMDPANGAVRSYRHDAADTRSLGADAVMALTVDGSGDLWVGTHGGGLSRFDAGTGSFVRYRHDPADERSLGADIVTAMASDAEGAVWLGTDGAGLNLLDRASGKSLRFRHDPTDPASLGSNTVFSLHLDATGRLWVGTRGAGLALLESRNGSTARFKHFTRRDGLANDVVYGILPDSDGYLWLSTNNGLSRFDPRTGGFKNYDVTHGLQSNEFNFGAHYRSASGELFFGGVNGLNAFHPRRLAANTHVPPVVLTALFKSNRPVSGGGPIWEMDGIDLGYRDDVVTFEFAALDYAAPARNRYAYRLEGFDSEWIELGGVRRITYTNLQPGRYRLRVRAANNDGVWNEAGLSLPLQVEAAPWRRWWAYLAYAVALGSVVSSFVRRQQARVAREAEYSRRLEEEVQRRTVELAGRNALLEDANRKLAEASLTDSLTGLRNRRFLFEQVAKDADLVRRRYIALKQGDQTRTFDLSFVMIDLDCFKAVNDTCGHAAGDLVLLGVRSVLEKICRASDVLIRWGGDEFLLVGRDNDPDQVGGLAERIRAEIEATTFEIGEGRVARTTCSVGYACYPFLRSEPELFSWEDMLSLADAALYAAKSKRNAWVGFLSTQQPPPPELSRGTHIDPERLLSAGALRAVASEAEMERGGSGAGVDQAAPAAEAGLHPMPRAEGRQPAPRTEGPEPAPRPEGPEPASRPEGLPGLRPIVAGSV